MEIVRTSNTLTLPGNNNLRISEEKFIIDQRKNNERLESMEHKINRVLTHVEKIEKVTVAQ